MSRVVIYYKLPQNTCVIIRDKNHPIAELKVRGQIVHVLNNPEATHVANQLFEQYQKDAGGSNMFQRHAMKTVSACELNDIPPILLLCSMGVR